MIVRSTQKSEREDPGEGRTIPLNSALLGAMVEYAKWYTQRFGAIRPEWYVFAFGKPWPKDPTRPMVTLKTSWNNVQKKAGVTGRWHDNRHTFITDLAESGAGDETIRDIAGHVAKQMLKHYSHIRMEAKRRALETILTKPDLKVTGNAASVPCEASVQAVGAPGEHIAERPVRVSSLLGGYIPHSDAEGRNARREYDQSVTELLAAK